MWKNEMEREYDVLKHAQHESVAWDMYFATLCGMAMHPMAIRNGDSISIQRCAELADRMLEERRKR